MRLHIARLRYFRKYSVTLVLPISDFISTFVGGGILSFLVSISDTCIGLWARIEGARDYHFIKISCYSLCIQ